MAVHRRVSRPAQSRTTAPIPRCTKDAGKPAVSRRIPGAGLSLWRSGKAPPDRPAFQPYWGKPAVRNERGDRGNVGIIRSPVRASILPDGRADKVRAKPPSMVLLHGGSPKGAELIAAKRADHRK